MSHCSSCGAPSDAQERIRELEGACAEMRAQIRNALLCSHHGDAYQYMQKALSSSAGTGWLSPQEADALRQELAEQKKALAEEVAFRLVVEARNLQLEAENKQLGMAEQDNDALRQERDAWVEDSRQANRNTEYYRGLVVSIGELFGVMAKTSDDGSIQEDVLCAKVPELADALRQERDAFNVAAADLTERLFQEGKRLEAAEQEAERLRAALQSVMEWAVHFATPMADELKETVRELLKEKADD